MLLVTALATGILNVLLFKAGLLGASGIVFISPTSAPGRCR